MLSTRKLGIIGGSSLGYTLSKTVCREDEEEVK